MSAWNNLRIVGACMTCPSSRKKHALNPYFGFPYVICHSYSANKNHHKTVLDVLNPRYASYDLPEVPFPLQTSSAQSINTVVQFAFAAIDINVHTPSRYFERPVDQHSRHDHGRAIDIKVPNLPISRYFVASVSPPDSVYYPRTDFYLDPVSIPSPNPNPIIIPIL
jgi:hypothetical protein